MQTLITLVHYFPIWAIPLALASAQFALHFMRRRKPTQYFFWFIAGTLILSSLAWIAFRGDVNGATWVRQQMGADSEAL